jgi:hypothetical protein
MSAATPFRIPSAAPVAFPFAPAAGTTELHVLLLHRYASDRAQLGGDCLTWFSVPVLPELSCCDNDDKEDASVCSACIETWAEDHLVLATRVNPEHSGRPAYEVLSNYELERALEDVSLAARA